MKKHIKKLLYSLLIAFMSIGISFDAEARLPKYMAQRAAELLIKKSELLKDDIMLVNADYDVLKSIIFDAVSKCMTKVNSDDFFTKVITEIEKHEKAIKRFVSALKDTKVVLPEKKTVENISEAMKTAVVSKLTSDYAANMVNFLYSTKNRQVLADCLKPECTFYKNKIESVPHLQFCKCFDSEECRSFQKEKLKELSSLLRIDPISDLKFISNLFPCWTGTLTCFIMNSGLGYNILSLNHVNQCKELQKLLTDQDKIHKVFSILFILEIIDDWKQLQDICENREGEPLFKPYLLDCVPVPNTMFIDNKIMHGSCLISTVRNLIAILGTTVTGMKEELGSYFRSIPNSKFIIPGIASVSTQTKWWTILKKAAQPYDIFYTADFPNFIETLNAMLQKPIDTAPLYDWFKTYRGYFIDYQSRNIKIREFSNKVRVSFYSVNKLIDLKLTEIMSGILDRAIIVKATINQHEIWPMFELKILDSTQKIEITVGIGNVGQGQHIEITNISCKQ